MEIKKRRVAIDKDDVLVDFNSSLQRFHNKIYDTHLTFEDVYTFDLPEIWRCSFEEAVKRVNAFYSSGEVKKVLPIEGAVEAVKVLKERFDLVIITSRPEEIMPETLYTTEKYFPGIFSGIYHTNLFLADWQNRRKKSEVCVEVGADTMIDDSLENVRDCASNGIKSLLMRRPWNLSVSDELLWKEGIVSLKSWKEIVSYFKNGG